MTTLRLRNIGQLTEADLHFGDLTVFVGPQATGKSIALQFLKLMVDTGQVQAELGAMAWTGRVNWPRSWISTLGKACARSGAKARAKQPGKAGPLTWGD